MTWVSMDPHNWHGSYNYHNLSENKILIRLNKFLALDVLFLQLLNFVIMEKDFVHLFGTSSKLVLIS